MTTALTRSPTTPPEHATALRLAVRRKGRRHVILAVALVAPATAFLILVFLLPILTFMARGVDNRDLVRAMPRTFDALVGWDRATPPGPAAFTALSEDLRALDDGATAALGRRLNYELPGFRSMILRTKAVLPAGDMSAQAAILAVEPRWGEIEPWGVLANSSGALTPAFLLAAIDLARLPEGDIRPVAAERAIYVDVFVRTFWISAAVTLICVGLGFPVAYVLAEAPVRLGNVLLVLVLMPFWTSVLVRTTAWVILLQQEGLVNQALIGAGLLDGPARLIFNRVGVYVAMAHVLLPFFILPLYGVMKRIPQEHMRAAASLGAPPPVVFMRVYLPQVMPGVTAGALIVFVTALGYYVTPVLVGGPGDQMVSYFVAFFTNESVNWGMASALGSLLLALVLLIYACFGRAAGLERARAG